MDMSMSNFKLLSIGIVATDKQKGSRSIEVYPIEEFPFYEGVISDTVDTVAVEGVDGSNQQYTVNLNRTLTVEADWIGEDNRVTSPNVVSGEQVYIYSTEAKDSPYYWRSMGRDNKRRRKETIVHNWMASSAEASEDVSPNAENSYTFTVDTEGKTVTLRTSKDDEEIAIYTIQIDAGKGILTAGDDEGNMFQLNTSKKKVTMINSDGTVIQLEAESIDMKADDSINLEAKSVSLEAGKDLNVKAKTIGLTATDSIDIKAVKDVGVTCKDFGIKATGFDMKAAKVDVVAAHTRWVGNFEVVGGLSGLIVGRGPFPGVPWYS